MVGTFQYVSCLLLASEFSLTSADCHSADGTQQGGAGSLKIACVGDSITEGAHASNKSQTYPSRLQKALDATHGNGTFAVTNLGHCGATMLRVSNSPYNRTGQYLTLTKNKWDIVSIMLGTNDAKDRSSSEGKRDNWQHDCGGSAAPTVDGCSFAADYKAFVEEVRSLGSAPQGPTIYAVIPPPLLRQGEYGMNQTVINSVFPKLLPLIQQDTGVELIDVFGGMGGVAEWQHVLPEGGCMENTTEPTACHWFCDSPSCDQCHPNHVGGTSDLRRS